MKIFEKDSKYNFVDKNNVFVGYDSSQQCCEKAGWFISDKKILENISERIEQLQGCDYDTQEYVFDIWSFMTINDECEGGIVIFMLVHRTKPPLYLHLFNCHNGYYSHGFEFKDGVIMIKKGAL